LASRKGKLNSDCSFYGKKCIVFLIYKQLFEVRQFLPALKDILPGFAAVKWMKKLNDLTPPELILLQKHVELGKDHLIELLGKRGLFDFLQWAKTKQEIVERNRADETEVSGNLILTINTIITGSFGGWMGLSAVMELNLHSPLILGAVFSFAALLGALIGYQNFRSTKMDAIENIQSLQMAQFEIDMLALVRQIREQELREIEADLFNFSTLKEKVPFCNWLVGFEKTVEEQLSSHRGQSIYPFLESEMETIKEEIKKNFEASFSKKGGSKAVDPSQEHEHRNLPPFIKTMISSYPKESKSSKLWIRRNARKILISLIPTLVGGFGSMFVYLSGTTEIAKAFEYHHLVSFLTSAHAKYVKLALALLFTAYFGFSFLYSNKKSYKRSRELEKKRELISKEESSLTLLDEQLFKLRKVREDVNQIRKLIEIAEGKR
jgi:hypothetical protein